MKRIVLTIIFALFLIPFLAYSQTVEDFSDETISSNTITTNTGLVISSDLVWSTYSNELVYNDVTMSPPIPYINPSTINNYFEISLNDQNQVLSSISFDLWLNYGSMIDGNGDMGCDCTSYDINNQLIETISKGTNTVAKNFQFTSDSIKKIVCRPTNPEGGNFLMIDDISYTTIQSETSTDILLSGTISAENNQIKNVASPSDTNDATTKAYVDALIQNLQNQINSLKEPPSITLLGDQEICIETGSTYDDDGATAFDDMDGDISSTIVVTSEVNTSIPGEYKVTYIVKDSNGNNASPVIRHVDVVSPYICNVSETTIENSASFGALGLSSYTELTGFTENNGLLKVIGSSDNYNQKTYLMFSDNSNWNDTTKVFMAEYNYNLNAQNSIDENFASGSSDVKNETTSIGSDVKYARIWASGSNYNVNININSREEPLFLVVETFGSNNQFNFIIGDTNDEGLISYWKNLLGSGNSEAGLSNSNALSKKPTKTQAHLNDILGSGNPNRVIWFSGDMINEILDSCSHTFTRNFDPGYPEPEFIAKNLGGYPTYISFLSDGYESNIAKFMNCNTSYNSPPY